MAVGTKKQVQPDEMREARRSAIQTIAELDRGLEIIELQLRSGKFMDARTTAEQCRGLVKMQDTLFRAYFRSASD